MDLGFSRLDFSAETPCGRKKKQTSIESGMVAIAFELADDPLV
jgi:hypothetical protein